MTSIIFISVLPCNAQYFITSVYYYYYCCLEAALLLHTCDYPWKWWWQEMKLHSLNHTTTAWALVVIKSPLVKIHVSASVYDIYLYVLVVYLLTYSAQLLTLGRKGVRGVAKKVFKNILILIYRPITCYSYLLMISVDR